MNDREARPDGRTRELSLRAVGFGLLLGGLLSAGNVYSGTKVGILDPGMTMIVLLSFAVFVAVRRPLSPLEINIAQTAGGSAATMALTAGVIGPVPALAMGGQAPGPVWVALWGAALGVFGTVIAVPFRRQLIEDEPLPFPTGQAVGTLILDLTAAGSRVRGRVATLFVAMGIAVLFVLLRDLARLVPPELALPLVLGGIPAANLAIGVSLSPLVLGVGVLVGLRIALSILLGGVVAWCALAPGLHARGLIAGPDYISALNWLIWPGVSLMVAGSLTSLAFSAGDLWRAWRRRRADRAGRWLGRAAAGLFGVAIVVIGWAGFGVHPAIGVLALVIAAVFSIISMRATGETDQSPAGPLGGLAQGLVGITAPGSTLPTLFAGGVTNGAAAHSAGLLQAYKAGALVRATPVRVVTAHLLGVAVGGVTAVLAYELIERAYGIGSRALPSPIAMSWKVTADVVQGGLQHMPVGVPLAALVACAAGVLLAIAERSGAARFVPSAVALGVGFLVPLTAGAGIALGAVLFAVARLLAPGWSERQGQPLAAGLITGEAVTGVVIAGLLVSGLLGG
jgi:uncharacterized oligopeptide transporter (OPT) family protein